MIYNGIVFLVSWADNCLFSEHHTNLLDYAIPKDTLVLTNLYAVHRQKDLWPAPDRFDPEANFLRRGESKAADENDESVHQQSGRFLEVVRTENLVPFGLGRRQCLGESLARQEVFLFLVGLLQRFRVVPDPSCPLASINSCTWGVVRKPFPFRVLFENCK